MATSFKLACLLGALVVFSATPALAVDSAYDGYAQGNPPLASQEAVRTRIRNQPGTPAAALLKAPGSGGYGYSAIAFQSGLAFAVAHRPATTPTLTAGQLLRQPGAGKSGYELARPASQAAEVAPAR